MKQLFTVLIAAGIFASCQKDLSGDINPAIPDASSSFKKGVYIFGVAENSVVYTPDMKTFTRLTYSTPVMYNASAFFVADKAYVYAFNPVFGPTSQFSSTDGLSWKLNGLISRTDNGEPLNPNRYFRFKNKWFGIVAAVATFTSDDGLVWTTTPVTVPGMQTREYECYFLRGDTIFMEGGIHDDRNGTPGYYLPETWMSVDAINWKQLPASFPPDVQIETITKETLHGISYAMAFKGGYGAPTQTVLLSSPNGYTWSEVSDNQQWGTVNKTRYNTTLIVYNARLYLLGGTASEAGPNYEDIWAYDGSLWQKTVDKIPYIFSDNWSLASVSREQIAILN